MSIFLWIAFENHVLIKCMICLYMWFVEWYKNTYQFYKKQTVDTLYFSIIFTQFEVLIKLVNGYILSQGTHIVIIGIRHDTREETNTRWSRSKDYYKLHTYVHTQGIIHILYNVHVNLLYMSMLLHWMHKKFMVLQPSTFLFYCLY